jgi:hypothetical protein
LFVLTAVCAAVANEPKTGPFAVSQQSTTCAALNTSVVNGLPFNVVWNMSGIMSESKEMDEDERFLHFESDWVKDFAGEYDFCMVFPAVNGGFADQGKAIVESLRKLDFELYAYRGSMKAKTVILLIRAPITKLQAFADNIDFIMKLDGTVAQKLLERGDAEARIAPVTIPHRPDITPMNPFDQIYGKYSRHVTEALYWREPGAEHPFRESIRLKLCSLLLESRGPDGEHYFNIRKSLEEKDLLGCFPLHDRARTQALDVEWKVFPWRALPLYHIKDYFGEKIAVYFAFMQHYTAALTIPAFAGLPIQIAVWSTNNPSGNHLVAVTVWLIPLLTTL